MVLLIVAVAFSCGGTQSGGTKSPGPGNGGKAADDLDVSDGKQDGAGGVDGQAGTTGTGEDGTPGSEQAAVTFRLKNSASEELVFSLDRGWQPVIFGFSGKPPKAKAIVMFPKFCTAACDAAETDRCPFCPQPEKVKDIRAAEKRETVAAGTSLDVPWDGEVFVYKQTKGKQDGRRTSCECYSKEPVAPETYTVRACGLRITKSATRSSKLQCVEGTMQFPSDGPQVVELDFPAP